MACLAADQSLSSLNMSACHRDPSTASLFVKIEHLGSVIGLVLNIVGIYYFYKETTRIQADLKYILLNVQFWLTLCDLIAGVFLVPDFLLPLPVFYPLGLFSRMGIPTVVQLLVSVTVYGATGAAIQHLFFMRHQSVLPTDHPRRFSKKAQILIIVSFYLLFGSYGVPLFFAIPSDQVDRKCLESLVITDTGIKTSLQTPDCIPSELWEDNAVIFDRDKFSFLLFYTIGYVVVWSIIALFLIIESYFAVNSRMYSSTTRGLIRRSYKSIIAQLISSFVFLIIPILTFILSHFLFHIPQKYGYIFVFLFSTHAAFGKITIAIFSDNFRTFLRVRSSATVHNLLSVPKRRAPDNRLRHNVISENPEESVEKNMFLKSAVFLSFLFAVLAFPKYEQRMSFGRAITVGSAEIKEEQKTIEAPKVKAVVAPLCNLTCIEDGVEWICCEEGKRQYPPAESAVSVKEKDRDEYNKELSRYRKVHRLHRLFRMIVNLLT